MSKIPEILAFIKEGGKLTQTASTLSLSKILWQTRTVKRVQSNCVVTVWEDGKECDHFRDFKKSYLLQNPQWIDGNTCVFVIDYPNTKIAYKYEKI